MPADAVEASGAALLKSHETPCLAAGKLRPPRLRIPFSARPCSISAWYAACYLVQLEVAHETTCN